MLTINENRFRESFDAYSQIGATENGGLHRLTLTDEDAAVRDQFVADLESIGLDVRIDRLGNIFGHREGTDPDADPVLIGSHLDSQPDGGRYDGQLGVLTALETLRTLDDADVETTRPIEIVNWTNEEGARFPHAMLGSAVFTGETTLDTALDLTDRDGVRLGDELERIGYAGSHPVGFDIQSHLELHIEQGPQLDDHGTQFGVVDGVYGMVWLRAKIYGETDHAGPTPMHTRRDAMATAADAISQIQDLPNRLSTDAVTTVGEFHIEPDSVNVIPDYAEFTVDIRSYDDDVVQNAIDRVEEELDAATRRHNTTYDLAEEWRIPHTEFDRGLRDTVTTAAEDMEASYEHLLSGAGHDAKYINDIAPTAMVFVPSVDGVTHNEGEFTEWTDCVAGAQVYTNAVERLANQ